MHYFHGVNPFGMTFLTNMYSAGASKSVKWMYHEWFIDIPGPPGYLVGGPNPDWPTGLTRLMPPDGQPPMKCYLDAPHNYTDDSGKRHEWWSYAYTEPMCNYQGAYVRLLACFVGKGSGSAR
ncbi:MAG: glycoside hydrolase family 9 protein [Treponema sp.]|nr:glycoside hydrolase family 9 protein [Treponema sp.]